MRALVFNGPHELTVESRPDPEPGPGDVVIDVVATGICGSDLHGYTGESGRRTPGQVMGHETVGRVSGFGPGDTAGIELESVVTVNPVIGCGTCPSCVAGEAQLCPDKRVVGVTPTVSGAFAERMVVPAGIVVPLPDAMPIEYGALIEPLAVGYHAAVRGARSQGLEVGTDRRVLVIGGGPIGQAAALAARRFGWNSVVVTEPDAGRRELVVRLGFDTVDPTAGEVTAMVDAVLGGPADLVLDAVGSGRSLADALASSTPGASVVLVGMNEPEVTIPAYPVSTGERTIVGSFCYSPAEFTETAAWVGAAPAELAALIDGTIGLERAPTAFADLAAGRGRPGKVLVGS